MTIRPDTAFVLAAGLGTRMRPLTDTTPKPLIEIAGRSLLDRGLDVLAAAGVTRAVVNAHWLGEQIIAHAPTRRDIAITEPRLDEYVKASVIAKLGYALP